MRALLRTLAVLAVVVTSLAWGAPGARADSGNSSATSEPLPASLNGQQISVVHQSLWVTPGVTPDFELDLRLSGVDVSTAQLQVSICPRLLARLNFDASLAGHDEEQCQSDGSPVAVSSLPRTLNGTYRVIIPLYQSNQQADAPAGAFPTFYGLSSENNGAYPVQVSLVNTGQQKTGQQAADQAVTTYIVSTPSIANLPKLSVSWVVPVQATGSDPATPLNADQSSQLESEIAALAAHPTPLTLAVDPSTVVRLGSAGSAGAQAVASLRALVAGGDEILPEPYVPIDVGGMVAAGQGSEVTRQYQQGASVLDEALGRAPSTGTWAFSASPVQPALMAQAREQGATDLALPASALSAVPVTKTSFANTTKLNGYLGVKVAGSDSALALHFTNSGDQVLQADQFLAELAMIDLETPSEIRGLAIVVPEGWTPNATFLSTVLAGLADSPLLQAQTLQKFFKRVAVGQSDGADLSLNLLSAPPPSPAPGAAEIAHARSLIASLSSTVSVSSSEITALNNQVLVGESADLTASQRKGVFDGIASQVTKAVGDIKLAPDLSVTLTSTSADVPVTILNNGTAKARVQLVLNSQKLSFRPFTSPAGECTAEAQSTAELCNLTVAPGATLLKVPVETRTSGVFALNLGLRSGDGSLEFGQSRYTVRSTAVSDVAVALMVIAAILLGVWWVRDRRHGRRARKLVDPPSDEGDDGEVPEDSGLSVGEAGPAVGRDPAPTTVPAVPPDAAERWSPAPPTRFRPRGRRTAAGDTPPQQPPGGPPPSGAAVAGSGVVSLLSEASDAAAVLAAPSPDGLAPKEGDLVGPVPGSMLWVDDDPVVAEFFATPPPFFHPAGNDATGTVEQNGSAQQPQGPGQSGSGR